MEMNMNVRNTGSNTPLYSDEEIKKLAKKLAEDNSQFTEEEYIRLIGTAYIPTERKVVRIDQKHDVIYYASKDNLKMPESSISCPDFNKSRNSDEEFSEFNDFFLSHKNSMPAEQNTNIPRLVLVEENNGSPPTKQSSSSTNLIYNALRNSSETFDLPDMKTGSSYKGDETLDRTIKQIHDDIPPGCKRMTMWCHELQDFSIATVPEETPELANEEYARYSSISPK
jgi:hypothetical protein